MDRPDRHESTHFFSLTPDRVLRAVEEGGHATTGRCYALGSLENRVYDVELENGSRVVAKFYRPGRWTRESILDEHRLLFALADAEIPACAPFAFPDGSTLRATREGIWFALFPRVGGRSPDDLALADYEQLGRLLGRIHTVSAALDLPHRPELSPHTYGRQALADILERRILPPGVRHRYVDLVERLVAVAEKRFQGVETFVVHADCHRGNLLFGPSGWFFLDFDDAARGPAVQDLWLLLPSRPAQSPAELEALLSGYERFRKFDRGTLGLIEILRALRYVRYAAWIATRWEDPSFPRAFPHYGTDAYWEAQVADLDEQLRLALS